MSVSDDVSCVDELIVGWICKKQASVDPSTIGAHHVEGSRLQVSYRKTANQSMRALRWKPQYDVDNLAAIKLITGENK